MKEKPKEQEKPKPNAPEIIELDTKVADEIVQRLETSGLAERDREIIRALFASYLYVVQLLQLKKISIERLKKLLFGARSEKTAAILGGDPPTAASAPAGEDGPGGEAANTDSAAGAQDAPPKRRKGHGRNGADDFPGAKRIQVPHESLQPGDPCSKCGAGTVYQMKEPAKFIRFVGQAPVQATIHERQRLRCNLCGTVFTAAFPEGLDEEKHDPTVAIVIALLKYGRGLPFNRLSELQDSLGIPLPAGTQWQLVEELAHIIRPVYEELVRQAAQGDVLYHDDTPNRILSLMGKRREATLAAEEALAGGEATLGPDRTGIYTSGVVSICQGHQAVVFFTGRQHAGENLRDVLELRARELERPIQMCDPLSRNMPADLKTILANCLVHARRQFADVAEHFSNECRYVIHALEGVYKNDETARRDKLSPEERLKFHQTHSEPIMKDLKEWLQRQFDERLVEPNSALGKAITYMLKHWDPLTLFLRKAGAPLDNNICERALKKVILHRKNALFYKTRKGARVGDLFMSLIHTCQVGGFNPFDYLRELVRHKESLVLNPAAWMPWKYRQTLESQSNPEPLPAAAA
jgi:transposase